jgi:hypothetical protein
MTEEDFNDSKKAHQKRKSGKKFDKKKSKDAPTQVY